MQEQIKHLLVVLLDMLKNDLNKGAKVPEHQEANHTANLLNQVYSIYLWVMNKNEHDVSKVFKAKYVLILSEFNSWFT